MLLSLILLAQFFIPVQTQVTSTNIPPIDVLEAEVLMMEVKGNRVRVPGGRIRALRDNQCALL